MSTSLSTALRLVACALLLVVLVRFLLRVARMLWVARSIPGPPARYLIGTVPELLSLQHDFLGTIHTMLNKYGTVWRMWAGDEMIISISEPQDLQVYFHHPAMQDKPSVLYDGLVTVVGQGLVSMPGDDMHKIYRKILDPTFSPDALRAFTPLFELHSRRLCERLTPLAASGEVFNVGPCLEDITVNVLVEAVAGDDASLAEDRERLARVLANGDKMVIWLACRPWFNYAFVRRLFCSRAEEIHAVRGGIDNYAWRMVDKWRPEMNAARKLLQQRQHDDDDAIVRDTKRPRTIMDDLIYSRYLQGMSEEDVKTGVLHVSVAGATTSTDLLLMAMQTLALQPEVQDRIYEEVLDVLGPSENKPVTVPDLKRLEYLERVIRETLRMFPAVHTIGRHAKEDVALPSGKVIPKGATVLVSLYNNFRDERWFPDPLKFDPDRFLPESAANIHPASFTPFSIGARNCIGHRFARLYVKTVLSSIVRRFRVLPAPNGHKALHEIKFIAGVSLHPIGDVLVRLEPRNTSAA